MRNVRVVVRNAARPSYLPVMLRKAWVRLGHGHDRERDAARRWAAWHARDLDAWGSAVDPVVWREGRAFARAHADAVRPRLERLAEAGVNLGGGGGVELLYLLTRIVRPALALETGVAAGWSTTAILAAMRANANGRLLSSDFPFFRLPDPERYIGYVVPGDLRHRWTLRVRGDRRNLEELLSPDTMVDLVHYDSDKTRKGREFFLRRVRPHLTRQHVLVMDDIQDNLVFREYAERQPAFRVFEYEGKFIGVTGGGLPALERRGLDAGRL
ncbi:class I SAM-dependent methyltransferase [Microbispora cellulosiformans]|uniref:Class I SAM-dependent methyltransferase n=1 Tax=Microbispora cellulosiformans TaxID=2614688 RepID=A0A5J5K2S7_9ACTN|nr:class I SAM-dependent methyltransferase [Microbispora cellulosiformans]KAA9377529.1 class I SAM-dependent methyltransferase [Microbispora cellulosiformans]